MYLFEHKQTIKNIYKWSLVNIFKYSVAYWTHVYIWKQRI